MRDLGLRWKRPRYVYADKDPQVFGRAVVGAVNDAVSYFLTHPGTDAASLAESLCRIFAP